MSEQMENGKLFSDFQKVSAEEWKQKMLLDLKGRDYESLTWKTQDGIIIKPFYTSEDLVNQDHTPLPPRPVPGSWEIRQDITVNDAGKANAAALHALHWGASSIGFHIPEGKKLSNQEFSTLLDGIYFDSININFITHDQPVEICGFLLTETLSRGFEPGRIRGSIDYDPIGFLSLNGRFPLGENNDLEISTTLSGKVAHKFKNLKSLAINGNIFHNAGATASQELGYSLAMMSDYLDLLGGKGIQPATIARSMQLNLAVGPVYFMEIAKIRAARKLFRKLMEAWGVEDEDALKIFIHCSTSEWNQTVYDPYVNMLRSTTESMSAALGGCDSLSVTPFDHAFRPSTKFSDRIARNTQIILKEEAWLDKVNDPSAGSYFIESLTDSLVDESWKVFLETEDLGGYISAFKTGEIQKRVSLSAETRKKEIAGRREKLLGTNHFPDPLERIPEDLEPGIAFPVKKNSGHLIAEPLQIFRGAGVFEKLRAKIEGENRKVFLLAVGNPAWRKARAAFSADFFACGGFEITDNTGFENVEEGVSAALSAGADIIVLCSSDEEYADLAPRALELTGEKAVFVVAGYPKDNLEDLKGKGVRNFIHIRSNLLEELEKYAALSGVKLI